MKSKMQLLLSATIIFFCTTHLQGSEEIPTLSKRFKTVEAARLQREIIDLSKKLQKQKDTHQKKIRQIEKTYRGEDTKLCVRNAYSTGFLVLTIAATLFGITQIHHLPKALTSAIPGAALAYNFRGDLYILFNNTRRILSSNTDLQAPEPDQETLTPLRASLLLGSIIGSFILGQVIPRENNLISKAGDFGISLIPGVLCGYNYYQKALQKTTELEKLRREELELNDKKLAHVEQMLAHRKKELHLLNNLTGC